MNRLVNPKTCQYCCHAKEAAAINRTILICDQKQGAERKFFVVAMQDTCGNFKLAQIARQKPSLPDSNGARLIPLTQGKFAIVDAEDYPRLSRYKWYACKKRHIFYACRRKGNKIVSMHREIINAPEELLVDHIDRDGLNNRKSNLRLCTIAQNNRNSSPHRNAASKYKGVSWTKCCRKWRARIRPNRRTIYLGLFDDEIEAARTYDRKAEQLFGQFAYLNFPQLAEFRKFLKILLPI